MSLQNPHSIDEAARAGCTTTRGVRFWEEQGLLGEVERTGGGTRRFSAAQLDRCRIIAAAQFGGWKLDDVRAMVENYDGEVRAALLNRLSDQVRAAARLAEQLPRIVPDGATMEFDL